MSGPPAGKTVTARSVLQRVLATAVSDCLLLPPSSSTTSKTALATTDPARPSIGSSRRPSPPSTSSPSYLLGIQLLLLLLLLLVFLPPMLLCPLNRAMNRAGSISGIKSTLSLVQAREQWPPRRRLLVMHFSSSRV